MLMLLYTGFGVKEMLFSRIGKLILTLFLILTLKINTIPKWR